MIPRKFTVYGDIRSMERGEERVYVEIFRPFSIPRIMRTIETVKMNTGGAFQYKVVTVQSATGLTQTPGVYVRCTRTPRARRAPKWRRARA